MLKKNKEGSLIYMKGRKTVFLVIVLVLGVLLFYMDKYGQGKQGKADRNVAGMIVVKGEKAMSAESDNGDENEGEKIQFMTTESVVITGDIDEEKKKIALTFDDGPHPFYTEQLLDGLKERGVKVTFFVTGEHASLHPEILKRMQEEGHLIGNHTYSHMQLRSNNRQTFMEELQLTNSVIKEITGEDTVYVRPPYGSWDKSMEAELNMIPVLWTIDPLDWCTEDVSVVVRKVKEKVDENAIILMHDYYASTVTAALKIVDILQEEGYVFVTVEEILFE